MCVYIIFKNKIRKSLFSYVKDNQDVMQKIQAWKNKNRKVWDSRTLRLEFKS